MGKTTKTTIPPDVSFVKNVVTGEVKKVKKLVCAQCGQPYQPHECPYPAR